MDIGRILKIVEVILSITLIVTIVLQQRGTGLGVMFGGGGESYRSKRGVEKLLFNITVVSLILFVLNGMAIAILSART